MDPAHAILREAGDAELVVAGTRSPNKMSAAFLGSVLLGSVSQSLLHHADAPVAIVRRHRES